MKKNEEFTQKVNSCFISRNGILGHMKTAIMAGMLIGSYAGSFIPMLWGESAWSITAIIFSGVGGLVGIWLGYKIGSQYL